MSAAPFTAAASTWACRPGQANSTRTFARCPEQVPQARRFVRGVLAGHPAVDDAELLACELVTNAVQHATDAAAISVSVLLRGTAVHVDVTDDGKNGVPHWREADDHSEAGRGFQLVNEIADRWGFLRDRAGTCVWFEVEPGLTRLNPPRPHAGSGARSAARERHALGAGSGTRSAARAARARRRGPASAGGTRRMPEISPYKVQPNHHARAYTAFRGKFSPECVICGP